MRDRSFISDKSLRKKRSVSVSFVLPDSEASDRVKSTVVEWLQALGCSQVGPDLSVCWLQDSFRNGVLLNEIVERVLGKKLPCEWNPKSEQAVKRNYYLALSTIERNKPSSFNELLYAQTDTVAQGGEDANWTLLWSLYNAYCHVLPPRLSSVRPDLPYDLVGITRLEAAVLAWISSIAGGSQDFAAYLPLWKTGVLLAKLVEHVCRIPLEGIFAEPKSEGAVLSNVRKSLDALKQTPCMSQKFLWNRERDIIKGNLGVALGLLEDLYRFSDGQPARRPGADYHADGPYLGLLQSLKASCEPTPVVSPKRWKPSQVNLTSACTGLVPSRPASRPLQPSPSLAQWLLSRGLSVQVVTDLNRGCTTRLRDGVVLCELVGGLTGKSLSVEKKSSSAGNRQNLLRALTALQQFPSFPITFSELSLGDGETQAWVSLLGQLKRLFPHSRFRLKRNCS